MVVCDSTDQEVQQKLRDSVTAASAARRERIAVVAGGAEESVTALTDRAKALNSERVVLAAPGGVSEKGTALSGLTAAAAVAGAIAGQGRSGGPPGRRGAAGAERAVNPVRRQRHRFAGPGRCDAVGQQGGDGLGGPGDHHQTRSGESEDATWRELSTVLIVDDVIPAIRESLRARFRRAKNTEQSRGAIRSQVVLELENKKAREIITGYDGVTVTALPENPTVCLVEFAFTVAHGLNQIWLTASITI